MGDSKNQSKKYAFEQFGTLNGVLNGDPIRIFPTGKWYRDARVLDITPDRLKDFAKNIKVGLPSFEAPINIEHDRSLGRYGSILDLEYIENGADGAGLYATKYQLTPEGRKLVEQEKFKGVSGEAVWSLNDGAKYQDPKTGNMVDNVLVGMALTNSSYFGKDVAMFSATPPDASPNMLDKIKSMLQEMLSLMKQDAAEDKAEPAKENASVEADAELFKDYTTEQRAEMAKNGQALPNGSYPIADKGDLQNAIHAIGRGDTPHGTIKAHIIKRAKALGATDMLPTDWTGASEQAAHTNTEVETMADPVAVQPVIQPEEFAALKVKADQFDAVKAQVELLAAENKKNAEMFAVEKKARRFDQLSAHYQTFSAIPVKADEFAAKMQAIEDKDVELFKYMDGLIATLNATIEKSSLFDQFASKNALGATDNFADAVKAELDKNYGGDMAKYGEAMNAVAKARPELAAEYKADVSKSGKAA